MLILLRLKGGPGSGHHDHGGRKGIRGGSTPGKGGAAIGPKLESDLKSLRKQFAAVAQEVYDEWDPEDEFHEYGGGGICDEIQGRMDGVVWDAVDNVSTTGGTQPGDEHANLLVYTEDEAYIVDIDPNIYERGSGYSYEKIEGVTILPSDVEIYEVDRDDVVEDSW
jgi:hypothetical protein